MKIKNKLILICIIMCLFICFAQNVEALDFTDNSPSDWYYSNVKIAADKGWVTGYNDGTFRPNNNVTYAEAVVMILRMEGINFNTNSNIWYEDAFIKAKENNYFPYFYIENYNNANNFITREDVFRIIYFAKDLNKLDSSISSVELFNDIDKTDEWQYVPINTLAYFRVVSGYDENGMYLVKPNNNITRAELCAILSRVNDLNIDRILNEYSGDIIEIRPKNYIEEPIVTETPGYVPIQKPTYSNLKGLRSTPVDIFADNWTLFNSMREMILSGYSEFYVKADLNAYNSTTVENRSSSILSLYSDAIYATFPIFTEGKEFNIDYEHIGNNQFLGKITISFRVGNGETKFAEYNRLVKYVQNDIQTLYSKGILNNTMTNRDKAIAVAEYISLNMQYDQSLSGKAHNPIGFYEGWNLVCDGYAGLFNVFMQELGYESYVISGNADGAHAWNLTKLDGQWLISDVTFADPVYYYNNVLTQNFNKDYIARTASELHKVDKENDVKYRTVDSSFLNHLGLTQYAN